MRYNQGNALFLILIAVALFAALSYAITQSSRGGGGIAKEQAMIDTAVLQNYMAAIEAGRMRLQLYGCGTIDYTPPADQTSGDDHSCHLFHSAGGGVAWQNLGLDGCDIEGKSAGDMAVGTACDGIIYAGSSGGKRLYTTHADQSSGNSWSESDFTTSTGATLMSDGMANTNALLSLPGSYPAAELCRSLGPDWYMPSRDEMSVLYANRNAGSLAGTLQGSAYWSSTEGSMIGTIQRSIWIIAFYSGGNPEEASPVYPRSLRCVRTD